MLRLSTRSLSAPLRMICLRCEVVEIGLGWGHVDSCGRGLRPGVWPSFQMGGDFHPSACAGDPLVWDGCHCGTPHARCPLGCRVAPPRMGGLAATQREWRPAQSLRGARRGCACPGRGRPMATAAPGRSLGLGGGSIQSCGGRVGDIHSRGGLDRARGLSWSMDMVRLVAASQPSWFVGVSGVDVVSGRTVGRPVESRSNLVG